ncbi:MAG TPA: hypothetical protein VE934_01375 [Polaromonas sp.]|uniref:hypothetical protein n=1 Tax=Polaromonas sp. TaxID=1869339 RepID=UPI002D2FE001|nr:hypothetical protein [Polaromonas sp.]HYW55584.1 hypothetical protein [Polaromonas sp.]
MFHLISRIARLFARRHGANSGVARQLMERAESRAGRNPLQARQLRRAAYAYLSVVR